MEKIKTLFVRDPLNLRYVSETLADGFEEVMEGRWTATRKYDGTAMLLDDNRVWWGRRRVKDGKPVPETFKAVYRDARNPTDTYGWEMAACWKHVKAFEDAMEHPVRGFTPGTYELVGPSINGNPEKWPHHLLIGHKPLRDAAVVVIPPEAYNFRGLRDFFLGFLAEANFEGIVWHSPEGKMVKLKVSDFRRD